ncbi:hypothetical protein [Latilactobacillus graminis]|uniref:Uncharacterized protein n=2 Tax=Latilactobacillus graminis TaxID=60519 RepID=A0AA89KWD6_9LACO|nr:hypothetical protein [Latilactobacillus graminis]KRM21043.1 hypothetical protein FC90_GL001578 [Latilactobacillus graminis DSM 20719]QFP79177.1 hypothetical protein LG542_02565 [Latilactobacillus graminis]
MQTSWLASTIAFELQNTDYPDESLQRRMTAVKEDVQAAEIQAVGEALASLHKGDTFVTATLNTKTAYIAK